MLFIFLNGGADRELSLLYSNDIYLYIVFIEECLCVVYFRWTT